MSRNVAGIHSIPTLALLPLALALAGAVPGCRKTEAPSAPEPAVRPNVLLVVLDTTRADYFSGNGHPKPTTPHVDALAAEGTRYTRAYATDFWTLPSHASLFTGLYPGEAGATAETNHLPERVVTLAERLQESGYDTGAVVCNVWISRERGFGQGFTDFAEMWRGENGGQGADTQHDEQPAVDRAVAWMTQRVAGASSPFFLFVNFNIAHLPYAPPPEVREQFFSQAWPPERVTRLMRIAGMWPHLAGRLQLGETDYSIMRELYEAEVARADDYTGQLVDALKRLAILDETLVIVTSDHGENIGDHGMIDHLLSMHETTLHIPMVIRYPGRFAAGVSVDDLVSLVDVMPTVLDVCGALDESTRPDIERTSLCREDRPRRLFVVAENERPVNGVRLMKKSFPAFDTSKIDYPMRAIRTRRHRLIWHQGREVELFDLMNDPSETRNVGAIYPEIREELFALLKAWTERGGAAADATMFESQDAESLERLRSLGYID
ncbi:MAG: sulfatase family protein [Planctomycetota bacterium]|jgi:arylsulfatase A-like enzyme